MEMYNVQITTDAFFREEICGDEIVSIKTLLVFFVSGLNIVTIVFF